MLAGLVGGVEPLSVAPVRRLSPDPPQELVRILAQVAGAFAHPASRPDHPVGRVISKGGE